MRQVSSATSRIAFSPSRSLRRNAVITQITYARPSTNTIPESLRTASSSPGLVGHLQIRREIVSSPRWLHRS